MRKSKVVRVSEPDEAATPAQSAAEPITLVQFPPIWGRNISPFALKLETWLRLADIPFDVESTVRLGQAPKGKLPYIVDHGARLGDSTFIIAHLKESRRIDPDADLDAQARAQALALQHLLEDHLYFILIYSRWIDDDGWALVSEAFFGKLPIGVRQVTQTFMRERMRKMLHLQGIGRHRQDEIYTLARADFEALATVLDDRPFFMGDQITTIDAVAYGFLANILQVPLETELKRAAQEFPSLVSWCDSMESGLSER